MPGATQSPNFRGDPGREEAHHNVVNKHSMNHNTDHLACLLQNGAGTEGRECYLDRFSNWDFVVRTGDAYAVNTKCN